MPRRRTLSLKREVLADLTAADLSAVVGANDNRPTQASCLAYMSCWWYQCLPPTVICPE